MSWKEKFRKFREGFFLILDLLMLPFLILAVMILSFGERVVKFFNSLVRKS